MSVDKYSNAHTIEVIRNDENLSLKTLEGGTIFLVAGDMGDSGANINALAGDQLILTGGNQAYLSAQQGVLVQSVQSNVNVQGEYLNLISANYLNATAASMDFGVSDEVTLVCGGEMNLASTSALAVSGKGVSITSEAPSGSLDLAYGAMDIIAKNWVYIQAEEDPYLGGSAPASGFEELGKITLHPHANSYVEIDGNLVVNDLAVNGNITFGGFSINNAVDWSDVEPSTGIKLETTHANGITLATPNHLAIISHADSDTDNRGCEVGGYFTQLKGRHIYIGANYESDYTDFWDDDGNNNKWEEYHGSGLHCKQVKIGAETYIKAELDGQGGGTSTQHVLIVSNSSSTNVNRGIKVELNSEGTYAGNWAPNGARWLEFAWGRPPYGTGAGEQYMAGLIKGVTLQDNGYGYGFLSATTGPGAPNNIAYQLYANETYAQSNPLHSNTG
ncbi:MAG: hypothetical protein MK009_04970, partial [Gammaproteobacteria bacterium]|nr:hypothetical protein [Gammaproteobacteria bacterium]